MQSQACLRDFPADCSIVLVNDQAELQLSLSREWAGGTACGTGVIPFSPHSLGE